MDKLYMILLCLMIVPILICIKYSRKIKSDGIFHCEMPHFCNCYDP